MATHPSSRPVHSQQPYDARGGLPPSYDASEEQADEFAARGEFERSQFASAARHREFETPHFNPRPNPLSDFLARFLQAVVGHSFETGNQLYTKSSFIILSGAFAGGVHYFASQQNPILSAAIDPSFHGSVALAKYVGLTFLFSTALQPLHKACFERSENPKEMINSRVVRYLTPMALAWIYAYYHGIPVKLATATLYTAGTIGVMKLLSMGYDYALSQYHARSRASSRDY